MSELRRSRRERTPKKFDDGGSINSGIGGKPKPSCNLSTLTSQISTIPNCVRPPRSSENELVHSAYKKVRRTICEEKAADVRKRWGQNREQLERDLHSHKSFNHLHNATRLIRRCSGGSEAQAPRPSSNLIKEFHASEGAGYGPIVSIKVFTPPQKSLILPPPQPHKPRGRGRPRLRTSLVLPPPDEEITQKIRARTVVWVERIPPVVSWTAIPFNVAEEDGKFLTNIPFLGDEIIDKDHKFIDDMLTLYQGNLHDLNRPHSSNQLLPPPPPPPLPSPKSMSGVRSNKRLDDQALLNLVQTLLKTKLTTTTTSTTLPETSSPSSTPSSSLFTSISQTFPANGSSEEVEGRYKSILTRNKKHNLPPTHPQDPSTYAIPNVDGPYAKDLPRESSMHAFQYLFCRRCYQYDCPRGHNGDDQIDLSHSRRNKIQPGFTLQYSCENPDCWRKSSAEGEKPLVVSPPSEWTPGEKSLFRSLIPSFPDPCYVAHLMLTKSCTAVADFAASEQTTPTSPTPPTPLMTGPTSKKRSKKSASSKKNLSRRWINSVRMRTTNSHKGASVPLPARFMPCAHHNEDEASSLCDEKNPNCYCAKNGTSCEKFCSCPATCNIRFPGCRCTSTCDSRRCVCFVAARECDPDLCTGCGANEIDHGKISCRNVNIQKRLHKHLLMGRSDVAGWGIFIKEDAQRGEFIAEYRGEIISHDESERRGHVYDKIQHTFLFELNDHFVVDATRKGNKARFVNSSKAPNCEVKRMLVNGDHRIGIYAKRFIDAGEELFYDYEDVLEKQQKVASAMTSRIAVSNNAYSSACSYTPTTTCQGHSSAKL